MKHVQCNRYNA